MKTTLSITPKKEIHTAVVAPVLTGSLITWISSYVNGHNVILHLTWLAVASTRKLSCLLKVPGPGVIRWWLEQLHFERQSDNPFKYKICTHFPCEDFIRVFVFKKNVMGAFMIYHHFSNYKMHIIFFLWKSASLSTYSGGFSCPGLLFLMIRQMRQSCSCS